MSIPNTWIVANSTVGAQIDPQPRPTAALRPHNIDIYADNENNALLQEIRGIISENPSCKILSDTERDLLANSILHDSSWCVSRPETIPLMSSGSQAAASYKMGSAGEARNPTCDEAIQTDQRIRQIINERCAQNAGTQETQKPLNENQYDNGSGWWPSWLTGGGIVAAIITVFRFIKQWRKVGKEMEEAGQSIGIVAKALAVLNKESEALMGVLKESMRITRRFFGETLVEFGKTLKYIFTGAWFRKKKKTEKTADPSANPAQEQISEVRKKMRQTNPFLIPARPASVNAVLGEPRLSVVLSQIRGWQDDKELAGIARRFSTLDKKVQLYITYEAIRGWYELTSGDEKDRKIAQDYVTNSLPLYGGLPSAFLKLHVAEFFRQKRDTELHAAADEWAKDTARKIAADVKPIFAEVERQFLTDMRIGSNSDLLRFMAEMAIDEWDSYNINQKASFITDIAQSIDQGQLPIHFIRALKRSSQSLVAVYLQLIEFKPELRRLPFAVINSRVKLLRSAWESLPQSIKKEFGAKTDSDKLPQFFIELFRSSLTIGTASRDVIEKSKSEWKFVPRAEHEKYRGTNLDLVKLALVNENSELAWYPKLLEVRSKVLIDDWQNLPANIKEAFLSHDKEMRTNSTLLGISVSYVKLWSRMNSGIGVAERQPLPLEDKEGGNGGSGSAPAGGASGNPPANQTGGLPAPSSPMQGMPFSILSGTGTNGLNMPVPSLLSGASLFMPVIAPLPAPVMI